MCTQCVKCTLLNPKYPTLSLKKAGFKRFLYKFCHLYGKCTHLGQFFYTFLVEWSGHTACQYQTRESHSSRRASAAQRSTFDNIEESLDHKMHPPFEQRRPPSLEAILDSRIMLAASHKCLWFIEEQLRNKLELLSFACNAVQ